MIINEKLIFWHIPSKAYAAVAPWWAIWNPCVGSINKEKVTPQKSEEGMMEVLEKRPSVKVTFKLHRCNFSNVAWSSGIGVMTLELAAGSRLIWGLTPIIGECQAIFVGHDHGLDWCCPYCYARHADYGGYRNWARGARIIEINQEPFGIKSWIRMENGDVHSEVVLNG